MFGMFEFFELVYCENYIYDFWYNCLDEKVMCCIGLFWLKELMVCIFIVLFGIL